MVFRMGRQDCETEEEASEVLAITDGSHENATMVGKMDSLELSSAEFVALMGQYTLGFANDENKGRSGRWCMNPYVFDNTYF